MMAMNGKAQNAREAGRAASAPRQAPSPMPADCLRPERVNAVLPGTEKSVTEEPTKMKAKTLALLIIAGAEQVHAAGIFCPVLTR